MRKGTRWLSCVTILVAVSGSLAETISLKPRYEPGTYVLTVKTSMDMTSTTPSGQGGKQIMTGMMIGEMEASAPDAQGAQTITLTFKRAAQSMGAGGMVMSYDSAEPDAGEQRLQAMLGPLLQHPLTVTIDPNGKVASVTGIDPIWEALLYENPGMEKMSEFMKEQLEMTLVRNTIGWAAEMAPPRPVAAGDSWEVDRKESAPMMGDLSMKTACTLKEIKSTPAGKSAAIAFTAHVEKDQVQGPEIPGAPRVTFLNLKIDQSGLVEILADSGQPLSYSAQRKQSMEVPLTPLATQPATTTRPPVTTMSLQQSGKFEVTIQKGKYTPPAPTGARGGATVPAAPSATTGPTP